MWYVIQVRTGEELAVREALQRDGIHALVPRENRSIHKGGKWTFKEYTLMPGYVFLAIDYNAESYYRVKRIPNVIRFLGTGSPSPLATKEAEWVRVLSDIGEPLQPTKVKKLEDGSLEIVDGVLRSFQARPIRFNQHTHRATLQLSICGEPKAIQLSIEFVE